ncbi:MAG: MurR/RpiR family transcriptional regulator, partial [Mesorhizobium sp.]
EGHGAGVRKRIEDIEKIRSANAVTLDTVLSSSADDAAKTKTTRK